MMGDARLVQETAFSCAECGLSLLRDETSSTWECDAFIGGHAKVCKWQGRTLYVKKRFVDAWTEPQ